MGQRYPEKSGCQNRRNFDLRTFSYRSIKVDASKFPFESDFEKKSKKGL
jgi:hypothetical protein